MKDAIENTEETRLSQKWRYLNTTLNENQYHLHYFLHLIAFV